MSDEFERLLESREHFEESLRLRAMNRVTPPVSEMLKAFFERSTEPMFVTNVAGRFLAVNAALGRLVGTSPRELLRTPVAQIYALPAERRRFRGTIEGTGRAHGVALTLKTRGGTHVPVLVDAVVWRLADGTTGGYVGVIRLEQRARAVRNDMEVYGLAVEGANEGLWNWDLQTEEVRYSARWKAILGFEDHEIHNSLNEWTGRIHPDDVYGFRAALRSHLRRERDVFLCHFRMSHKDGGTRWMLARGVAEFGPDGTARRIAGSLSNVSAHMQVIERLKQEGTLLEAKNRTTAAQRDAFSRYIPEELRSDLVDRGEESIRSRNSEATVLYVRIEEAAYYHAHLSAERFGVFLNELLSDIADLIHGRRGVLARIEGDAITALFGAFARQSDDVDRAFATAESIRRHVRTYNDVRDVGDGPAVTVSIGISYGMVFTGTTGNIHRLDFTCYGAPIRRAQLLQARVSPGNGTIIADRSAAARTTRDWCLEQVSIPSSGGTASAFVLPDEATTAALPTGCTDPELY